MRSDTRPKTLKLAYLAVIAIACYFLIFSPFSYSYFNSNFVSYGYNKKLCQLVENKRLPLVGFIQSVSLEFTDYMNEANPSPTRLKEQCPER